jgi:hypothetical protein
MIYLTINVLFHDALCDELSVAYCPSDDLSATNYLATNEGTAPTVQSLLSRDYVHHLVDDEL